MVENRIMNKGYILFTINGEIYFIRNNDVVGMNSKCSYYVKGLRKLPTTKILENLFTNITSSIYNERLVMSDIHPGENVRELFETPPANLVKLIRELPGAFDLRKRVRRAWIL